MELHRFYFANAFDARYYGRPSANVDSCGVWVGCTWTCCDPLCQVLCRYGNGGCDRSARELCEERIGAALALSTILGLICAVLVVAGAELAASIYEMPALRPVLQWLALGFFISGLSSPSQGLLRRRLDFKYLSLVDIISYVVGYGFVGVYMAYRDFGVYALVGANLAQLLMQMVLLYGRTRHTLRIPIAVAPYREMLLFGGGYSFANFLTFMAANLDQLVIGKIFPAEVLGVYSRAKYLVSMPMYQLLVSLTQVLFPAYAGSQDDPKRLRHLFMNGMLIIGMLLLPPSIGMIAAANQIVAVLLGPQWESAVPILQICALFVPIDLMTSVGATMCSATGRLRAQIYIQLATLTLLGIGLLAQAGGTIQQVAMVVAIVYWIRFIIYIYIVKTVIHTRWIEHIRIHLVHAVASVWVYLCIDSLSWFIVDTSSIVMLFSQVIIGMLALFVFVVYGPFPHLRTAVLKLARAAKLEPNGHKATAWLLSKLGEKK